MDRFSLAQVGFNLVFLVNIFYLHRKLVARALRPTEAGDGRGPTHGGAQDGAHEAGAAPPPRRLSRSERRAAARALRSGPLLTVGLGASADGAGAEADARALDELPRRDAPLLAARPTSLDDLIAAAERAESGAALQACLRRKAAGAAPPPPRALPGPERAAGGSRPEAGRLAPRAEGAPSSGTEPSSALSGREAPPRTGREAMGRGAPGPFSPRSAAAASSAVRTGGEEVSRQRAAEDLRANIRRLQARFEGSALAAGAVKRSAL